MSTRIMLEMLRITNRGEYASERVEKEGEISETQGEKRIGETSYNYKHH